MSHDLAIRVARDQRDAHRKGLTLSKSRRRRTDAVDFGTYKITDATTGVTVWGGPHGGTLQGAESFLSTSRRGRPMPVERRFRWWAMATAAVPKPAPDGFTVRWLPGGRPPARWPAPPAWPAAKRQGKPYG